MIEAVLRSGPATVGTGPMTFTLGLRIAPAERLKKAREAIEQANRVRQWLQEFHKAYNPKKLNEQRKTLNEDLDRLRRAWEERIAKEGAAASEGGTIVADVPPMWLADP